MEKSLLSCKRSRRLTFLGREFCRRKGERGGKISERHASSPSNMCTLCARVMEGRLGACFGVAMRREGAES